MCRGVDKAGYEAVRGALQEDVDKLSQLRGAGVQERAAQRVEAAAVRLQHLIVLQGLRGTRKGGTTETVRQKAAEGKGQGGS